MFFSVEAFVEHIGQWPEVDIDRLVSLNMSSKSIINAGSNTILTEGNGINTSSKMKRLRLIPYTCISMVTNQNRLHI